MVEIVTRNQSAVRTLIIPYPEFTNNECDMFKIVYGSLAQVYYQEE